MKTSKLIGNEVMANKTNDEIISCRLEWQSQGCVCTSFIKFLIQELSRNLFFSDSGEQRLFMEVFLPRPSPGMLLTCL